jgi:hypothetical protein
MELVYNTPIEVTEKQYKAVMNHCSGIVAGREDSGKYYIKVWFMKYAWIVKRYL